MARAFRIEFSAEYGMAGTNMTKASTQATKRTKSYRQLALATALFAVGVILDYYMWRLSAAMTGAGHGIYSTIEIEYGPFMIFAILWPFLIAAANVRWRWIRMTAKGITSVYYVWLLTHPETMTALKHDYQRLVSPEVFSTFWMWAALVFVVHGLIWLPIPVRFLRQ